VRPAARPRAVSSRPGECSAIWAACSARAGIGGLLNGGIGELLERFNQNGQGEVADSWVKPGPNKEISSPELRNAIGSDVLEKLEQQTGLSQDEILTRLSRELPSAVDKYTPDGRLPEA
jgi:uncharacterized protein YidB (DUF937 family)